MQSSFPAAARVAVFVDGDNLSAQYAEQILAEAQTEGTVDLVRIYGNALTCPKWRLTPGVRFVDAGTGKNASDMLLCVDAMKLTEAGTFDIVFLASSDVDFRHLAFCLREKAVKVVGLGEAKAPDLFSKACTRFVVLGPTATPPLPPQSPDLDLVARQAKDIIAERSAQGLGALLTELSPLMKSRHDVRISATSYRTWRQFFASRPQQFDIDAKSQTARVRFKREGFTTSA